MLKGKILERDVASLSSYIKLSLSCTGINDVVSFGLFLCCFKQEGVFLKNN